MANNEVLYIFFPNVVDGKKHGYNVKYDALATN